MPENIFCGFFSDQLILCIPSGDPVWVSYTFSNNLSVTPVGVRIIGSFCRYIVVTAMRCTTCCKNVPKTGLENDTHGGVIFKKIYFLKRRPICTVTCCLLRFERPMPDTVITKLLWGICRHPQPSLKLSHASYTIFAPKSATHGGCQNFGLKSQYVVASILPTTIC